MVQSPRQEPLPFKIDDNSTFETLVTGANTDTVAMLKKAVADFSFEQFYIFGPHGCGKSHLLNALFRSVTEPAANVFFIDLERARTLSPLILDINPPKVVLLDNIEAAAGDDDWELALFSLYNRWQDHQAGVLIASAVPSPDRLAFNRRDLNTRFGNGISCPLERLNEEGCILALQLKAKKRGFKMPFRVGAYLIKNSSLEMRSLMKILDKLDTASLEEQRVMTIPFIKKILGL